MSCADFLADLEAKQLVPDKHAEFEAFTNWLLGRHVAMAGAPAALEKTQRMDRLGAEVVRACRKAPKKSFADVASGFGDDERRAMFAGNANRLYRLGLSV
jgi:hypothetical protein